MIYLYKLHIMREQKARILSTKNNLSSNCFFLLYLFFIIKLESQKSLDIKRSY
jgi:hypothetical protein